MTANHSALHAKHEQSAEALWSGGPALPNRYALVLTNTCNLRCPFCFQHKRKLPNAMTTQDWLHVIEQIPAGARITLTGGEPLAFKGFVEVFKAATDKCDVNIITNGVLLNEKLIDMFVTTKSFKVLSLSIDDVGNHSRLMKPKEWQTLVDMGRYFVKRRNEEGSTALLDVKTVVLDERAEELFGIYDFCKTELNCDTHAFQMQKGSPLQHADAMFDFELIFEKPTPPIYEKLGVLADQFEQIRQDARAHDRRVFLHPDVVNVTGDKPLTEGDFWKINQTEIPEGAFQSCRFPWASVHINADGHLFPCLAVSMGNVKTQTLPEVIFSETYDRFRKVLKDQGLVPTCHRCGWLRECKQKQGLSNNNDVAVRAHIPA